MAFAAPTPLCTLWARSVQVLGLVYMSKKLKAATTATLGRAFWLMAIHHHCFSVRPRATVPHCKITTWIFAARRWALAGVAFPVPPICCQTQVRFRPQGRIETKLTDGGCENYSGIAKRYAQIGLAFPRRAFLDSFRLADNTYGKPRQRSALESGIQTIALAGLSGRRSAISQLLSPTCRLT